MTSDTIFLEHKTDTYSNGKSKLYVFRNKYIFPLVPYSRNDKNGISYGLSQGNPKKVEEENITSIDKYYKRLSRKEFFEKEITHIPT